MLKTFLKGGLLGTCIALASCAVAPGAPMASAEGDNRETNAATESPFEAVAIDYAASDPVLGFVDSRPMTTLNGEWNIIVDPMGVGDPGGFFGGFVKAEEPSTPYDLIEYNFANSPTINVPGDFNTQDERLFFYQGRVWYSRKFSASPADGQRQHLWFGGANFKTTVFLNGEAVGEHEGGYVPFSFDVTDMLSPGENTLVVRADNRLTADTVPTLRTDWWPYGGLTRDVALIQTPDAFIRNARIALSDRASRTITAEIQTENVDTGQIATVSIPELGASADATVTADGSATVTFQAPVDLWSPESPKLYTVRVSTNGDTVEDRVGFRTIETRGQEILLNGEPIHFLGISTHEEAIGRDGAAYSEADVRRLLQEAKALNANFVRAAHYPYSRHMARAADEMGVMLWEEVPVYWNIQWENEDTLAVARDQMARLVERDWNRASVVVWSVANETPYSEPRMDFLGTLISDTRERDPSRLVSAALLGNPQAKLPQIAAHLAARGLEQPDLSERDRAVFQTILDEAGDQAPGPNDPFVYVVDDPLGEFSDIISYNEYFGWYYSMMFSKELGIGEDVLRPLMLDFMPDIRMEAAFDKPMHISEFGAGALAGKRGEGIWTEDYQASVYNAQIAMLSNSPQIQGMTPWILKDFRAMLRPLPGIQDYRNRKGLIDQNGRRKLAFDVLRDFYGSEWANAEGE